jgi:hypothetical protein
MKLLQDLLRQQTFKYECDVRCLIISSTKSILSCDVTILHQSEQEINQITFPNLTKEQIGNVR